jgi:hypothetical protein
VENNIQMADFVSQYPTVLLGTSIQPISKNRREWALPVGTPKISKHVTSFELDVSSLGIAKVLVVPPAQLYGPFLSYRVHRKGTYEVLFGLCRTCMEKRVLTYCTHTEPQRAFVGTYTLAELRYAMQLGYQIKKWIEVWEYPEGSNSLFQNLILPCMVQKIKSKRKGLLNTQNEWTALGRETKEYLEELLGREVTPEEFEDLKCLQFSMSSNQWRITRFGFCASCSERVASIATACFNGYRAALNTDRVTPELR